MIAIGNYNLRIIVFKRNYYTLSLFYRINFFTVYYNSDVQKAEQNLLFPGNDNMIGGRNNLEFFVSEAINRIINYFKALIISIKSCAIREAPPTKPPSTSGQLNN